MRRLSFRGVRLLGPVLILGLAAALGGCKTVGMADTTGSIAPPAGPRSEDQWRREAEGLGEQFRANPRDPDIAIRYSRALRGSGQRVQAAAVLEQAAIFNGTNKALLGAYGRALADAGNYTQALDVLSRAHTPDQPDWRILSVQGAVLDQMGRHDEAQRYYASALKIVPDEPSVLSNLGLSYALSKDLKRAEETLRRASAKGNVDRRVRQNLALVVGLQGRFGEAETIARAELPPEEAQANVAYLRQMLAQQRQQSPRGKTAKPRIKPIGLDPVEDEPNGT
jgi:Flp pilus assembly protein TadD